MRLLLTSIACCLLFITCKKGGADQAAPTPPPPTNSTNDITIVTVSAVPGEVVVAQANFQPTKDTATILVGGKAVFAAKADSNRIVFIMPELQGNTTATIQYRNMGVDKQLSISVGSYTPLDQPDPIVNEFLSQLDQTIQNYKQYENSTVIPLDPSYGRLMLYARQNFATRLATLSSEDKKQVAYTIRAYKMDAQESKMDTLNTAFFARLQSMEGDPEEEYRKNTTTFLTKSTRARIQIVTGMGLMLASLGTGPVVAIAGAYVFLDGVKKLSDANADSYSKSINAVATRTTGTDIMNRIMANSLVLNNDLEKRAVFKGFFRTVIQQDAAWLHLVGLNYEDNSPTW